MNNSSPSVGGCWQTEFYYDIAQKTLYLLRSKLVLRMGRPRSLNLTGSHTNIGRARAGTITATALMARHPRKLSSLRSSTLSSTSAVRAHKQMNEQTPAFWRFCRFLLKHNDLSRQAQDKRNRNSQNGGGFGRCESGGAAAWLHAERSRAA
jgi:hypothetical protein